MKKLMITAAIVCAAVASQASTVNWQSTAAPYFFDTSTLAGNKDYTAGTTTMYDTGRAFAYTLVVTTVAAEPATVGSASGNVSFNMLNGKFKTNGITIGGTGAISVGTTYNYLITITTSLSDIGKSGEWDYSSAIATETLSGTFTGANGSSTLSSVLPSSWTVTGATKEEPGPGPVPEPTSAMLMLLGVAGLALRRKQK